MAAAETDPDRPSAAPAAREPWTLPQRALLALLVVALAARFLRLDGDPPYLIYENTDTYVADEAWYLKCSLLLERFGTWRAGSDLAPFTHNPLQTLLYAAVFQVAGPGIVAARTVAVAVSVAGVAGVAALAAGAGRTAALVAALVVATSIQNFGQSRLASPENLALTLSLASLALFRPDAPARRCALSMTCAVLAFTAKVSFVFTGAVAGAAWAWTAFRAWRGGDRSRALRTAWVLAGAAALVAAFPVFMRWYAPAEFEAQNRFNVGDRARDLSLASVLANEWAMVRHTGLDRFRAVATLGAVAGLATLVAARLAGRQAARPAAGAVLVVVWGALGALLHGWTPIQPPRYYAFLVAPLAVAAVAWVPLAAPGVRVAGLALLLAGHAAVQWPGYATWFGRRPFATRHAMALDAASILDREPGSPAVVGLHATTVALESARVRPVDWQFAGPDEAAARLVEWRPRFAVGTESEIAGIVARTSGRAAAGDEMARWQVFRNYPRDRPVVLVRLVWR